MSSFFRRLFSSDAPSADGFSQTQREALLDLLNFCMCADNELVPAERDAITTELKTFHWDPAVDIEAASVESLDRATEAMGNAAARTALLESISKRLSATETKTIAIELCHKVFLADGEFAPEEREIFREIKRAFGWPD